ncbi:MAG TPA: HEAT repeat domain-containing protein [Kofleriaceae bacterium]|jgi:HEAT repeat protein|nr:HEAT repeat domain-containing protein [Kofleriaceae bacterium]
MRNRLAICLACALLSPAAAAPKPTALGEIVTALDGVDEDAAARSATALGDRTEPAAHEALLDALAWGLEPGVATAAIAALAKHPAPPDLALLRRYAGHHDVAVRSAALGALALYPDPIARNAIAQALRDPNATVRAAAAQAAVKGHVKAAIEPLFALLGLGEDEAAKALAAMADAELVRRIGDQLGKVPDPALASCLGLILQRADFGPDTERVEVVRALAKISDASATAALTDYVNATPANPPRASRAEAMKIVEARGAGK